MKSAQVNNYGGTDLIKINNTKQPVVKSGQLLVEVHAASLNRVDSAIRNGYLKEMLPLDFPITLAGDFAGIVAEVGEDITDFKIGDEVYGNAVLIKGGSGSLAEFVSVNAKGTGYKPKSLDFVQSAACPLMGTSAVEAIEGHIKLKARQKILIHGGSGAAGNAAIQLARLHGAHVVTTVKRSNITTIAAADQVINNSTEDFTLLVNDFDAVFDTVGGDLINKSFSVLRKGGTLVTLAGQPDKDLALKHDVTAISQLTEVSTTQLKRLAQLIDIGKINIHIDKVFPFEESQQAFEYFENSPVNGKIVITVK